MKDGLTTSAANAPGRVPKIQAGADLVTLREAIQALQSDAFKQVCSTADANAAELGRDADSLNGLSREALLKSALELYDGTTCPVCDTPFEPDAFGVISPESFPTWRKSVEGVLPWRWS